MPQSAWVTGLPSLVSLSQLKTYGVCLPATNWRATLKKTIIKLENCMMDLGYERMLKVVIEMLEMMFGLCELSRAD
jgi:hypothetical protein